MRKTFLILSLLGISLMVSTDASARGNRGRGCGDGGSYLHDSLAFEAPSVLETRRSFYFDPALPQSAQITVFVPSRDAEVWFNEVSTSQRGVERVFRTPGLEKPGVFIVKTRWMVNGQTMDRQSANRSRAGPRPDDRSARQGAGKIAGNRARKSAADWAENGRRPLNGLEPRVALAASGNTF